MHFDLFKEKKIIKFDDQIRKNVLQISRFGDIHGFLSSASKRGVIFQYILGTPSIGFDKGVIKSWQ